MSVHASADIGITAVRACLTQARSRWRFRSVLRGAVWSLLLGLVVFCALEATAGFLDGSAAAPGLPGLSGRPSLNHLALSAIVFACALGLAVLLAVLAAPDLAALARVAERTFALQERLSTALEIANLRSDSTLDPVRAALLADAEGRAGAIDPRKLVRLTLPRAAWAVPAMIAAAILLQVVPPDAFGRSAPDISAARAVSDDGGMSRQQAADTAANLRRIAEILDQDATQRSDPYLRTIARTLERLSIDVAQATVDRRRLASELDQLLAHAQQAYAQSDRPAGQAAARRNATELLRAALDDITGNRQGGTASARDPDPAVPEAAAAGRDPAGRPAQPQDRRATGSRSLSELIAAARRLPGGDISWLYIDEDGTEADPRAQIERLMAEEERRARAAAQPAGAAANAGQGEGDRAGDGVQPLGRDNAAKSADLAAAEQMLLPDPERRDGGRIRIEIPPDAALSDVAAPTSDASSGWRRVQEQSVEHPALAAEGRRVVGRYFKRATEGRRPEGRGAQGRSP